MAASSDLVVFEMTRAFQRPRDVVWRAWSEAEQLRRWWGPKGCTIELGRFEFRLGGFVHYAMNFAGAPTMWGRFNYREIQSPERLVWLSSFANERCGIVRGPFSERLPMEIENAVTFTEHAGRTQLSLRATPFGATDDELKFFDDMRPSLQQGYGGTIDQLADHLARL